MNNNNRDNDRELLNNYIAYSREYLVLINNMLAFTSRNDERLYNLLASQVVRSSNNNSNDFNNDSLNIANNSRVFVTSTPSMTNNLQRPSFNTNRNSGRNNTSRNNRNRRVFNNNARNVRPRASYNTTDMYASTEIPVNTVINDSLNNSNSSLI